MNRFITLLILSFAGSVASIFLSRGIYFFTKEQFHFAQAAQLWLAVGSGLAYVLGALPSHALVVRLGERKVMQITVLAQILILLAMFLAPKAAVVVVGLLAFQLFNAMMWPIVESYVSAGRNPRETARALGRFNITWALAAPLGVYFAGPIIGGLQAWLFGIAVLLFVAVAALGAFLPARIEHLAHDHPERHPPERMRRYRHLLISSRWLLIYSYSLVFLLVPLFPGLFRRLGYDVEEQTRLASVVDTARWFTFIALHLFPFWRNRADVLVAAGITMPACLLVLLQLPPVGVILAVEILFGIAWGVVYHSALYYAMVVKNASVDAGGAHESLIGLGYSIGPLAGLIGLSMAGEDWMLKPLPLLVGVGPLIAVCTIGAAWPLVKMWRSR